MTRTTSPIWNLWVFIVDPPAPPARAARTSRGARALRAPRTSSGAAPTLRAARAAARRPRRESIRPYPSWRFPPEGRGSEPRPPENFVQDLLPPALHLRSRLPLPRVLVLHRGVVVVVVFGPEVGLAELGEVGHGWLLDWVWRSMGGHSPT